MVTIAFDLDMTLVDTSKAILWSVKSALAEFNESVSDELIERSIGLPLIQTLESALNSKQKAVEIYERYQEVYQKDGYLLAQQMPGAKATLESLHESGHKIIIITAKKEKLAIQQLQFCDLPFNLIQGSCFRETKTSALLEVKAKFFVGDHIEDYLAAERASVPFIGVNFNQHSTLNDIPEPGFTIIQNLSELIDLINT